MILPAYQQTSTRSADSSSHRRIEPFAAWYITPFVVAITFSGLAQEERWVTASFDATAQTSKNMTLSDVWYLAVDAACTRSFSRPELPSTPHWLRVGMRM
ncbi:hypothetical protein P885DRAFT_77053 [Corynascus similis CBS 632.67]